MSRAHKTDPRAATSIVIGGMTLGLALMVTLSLDAPVRPARRRNRPGRSRRRPRPDKVTIVAATPAPRCALRRTNLALYRSALPDRDHAKTSEPDGRREAAPRRLRANATAARRAGTGSAARRRKRKRRAAGARPIKRESAAARHRDEEREPAGSRCMAVPAEWDDDVEGLPVLSPREMRRMERGTARAPSRGAARCGTGRSRSSRGSSSTPSPPVECRENAAFAARFRRVVFHFTRGAR